MINRSYSLLQTNTNKSRFSLALDLLSILNVTHLNLRSTSWGIVVEMKVKTSKTSHETCILCFILQVLLKTL